MVPAQLLCTIGLVLPIARDGAGGKEHPPKPLDMERPPPRSSVPSLQRALA